MSLAKFVLLTVISASSSVAFAGAMSTGGLVNDTLNKGILLNFQSIGAGIDVTSRQAYLDLVKKNLLDTSATTVVEASVGQEGEITSCLEFKNVDDLVSTKIEIEAIVGNSSITKLETIPKCDSKATKFTKGLVVSFESLGAGIELKAREDYLNIVAQNFFSANINLVKQQPAGPEGEVISCIQFNDATGFSSTQKELRKLVKNSSITTLKTVSTCSN